MTRQQQPRIDLNHGYMRFIRRNQLDRDEYNRVHEQRKSQIKERLKQKSPESEKSETPSPEKEQVEKLEEPSSSNTDCPDDPPKEMDAEDRIRGQVRRRLERTQATVDEICRALEEYTIQEKEKSKNKNDDEIFTLEITLKNGEKKTIGVPRNTKAARLAKSLSRENNFDDLQCRNLRIFIEEQLELRLAHEKKLKTSSAESSLSTTSSDPSSTECEVR